MHVCQRESGAGPDGDARAAAARGTGDSAAEHAATELRTAVLWYKAASVYKPDYYAQFLETSPWIHQPFETYEGCDIESLRRTVS